MAKFYSYEWAAENYYSFKQIHEESVTTLQRLYGISDSEAIKWLQADQKKWNAYKKCAKYLTLNLKTFTDDWNSESPRRMNYLTFDRYLKRMLENILSMGESAIDILLQRVLF